MAPAAFRCHLDDHHHAVSAPCRRGSPCRRGGGARHRPAPGSRTDHRGRHRLTPDVDADGFGVGDVPVGTDLGLRPEVPGWGGGWNGDGEVDTTGGAWPTGTMSTSCRPWSW